MPVLGICGDSFMAATLNDTRTDLLNSEGKHFTEILAKKIKYDYFTLARGACSNTAIRLQIDELIKREVDLAIIGTTSQDRLEIPNMGKKFNVGLGVYNLDYRTEFYPDRSTLNPNFKHNLISETLTNIFHNPVHFIKKILNINQKFHMPNISDNQLLALEYYFDYLYDPAYKLILDSYIMLSGIKALEINNIPFVIIWNELSTEPINLISDHRIIRKESPLRPNNWENGYRRWHTSDEAQEKGAKLWYDYLLKYGYLKN